MRLGTGAMMPWSFARGNREFEVGITGPVIVNDFHAMMVAVRTGVAMGMLAEPTAKALADAGELELLLTDQADPTSSLFLHYPRRKQLLPKLHALTHYCPHTPPKTNTKTH